jgi:NAD(P)-dependent dehydrogenase (short-subunit alcohol dehydrogenase family)
MQLNEKVAIITGGGKGIGRAIALAFAADGAAVVLAGRTLSKLEETADVINKKGGRAAAVQTDVSHEKQVERMVAETVRTFGKIDILVNNAGIIGPTANVVDINLNEWNEALAINLTGSLLACKHVLKHMIPLKSGAIVNIGSERGRTGDGKSGSPMRTPYSCSKAGMVALTESLSVEVGKYNIRVNCVTPGPVKGERIMNVLKAKSQITGEDVDELLASLVDTFSLKRATEEEEVAAATVFLASNAASGITGQTLSVTCGQRVLF